jgi:hypothetical protein
MEKHIGKLDRPSLGRMAVNFGINTDYSIVMETNQQSSRPMEPDIGVDTINRPTSGRVVVV